MVNTQDCIYKYQNIVVNGIVGKTYVDALISPTYKWYFLQEHILNFSQKTSLYNKCNLANLSRQDLT